MLVIKEIDSETDLQTSLTVIQTAFATVAEEFNLTRENAPTNGAFIDFKRLKMEKDKGIKMYGAFREQQIGFMAIEKAAAGAGVFYLEKLAVLPEYRHQGYGKLLLDFAFDYVRAQKGERVQIGIIDENMRLKNWYTAYGFIESGLKKFDHLPFTVCFLEKRV